MNLNRFSAIAVLVGSLLVLPAAAQLDKHPRPTQPDAQGNHLYIVNLDVDTVERQNPAGEAAARAPMDPLNAIDFRGWHKPKVRTLVRELERDYGIEATTMTSHALPSFSAYIPEAVLQRLRGDPRVERIIPTSEARDYSQVPPWGDQVAGGETIPYGKIAIGTNDAASASNIVYMIDAGPPTPHNDLVNVVVAPAFNPPDNLSLPHAFHVAGILSAAMNNAMVRGINPGAQIIAVNRGESSEQIRTALDWVMGDAEWRGIHAIANISSNGTRWANGDPSQIANFMRRMSNRLLVVQSAGNQHDDACLFAYSPTNTKDGLLVVSAVDENGQQPVPFAVNAVGWTPPPHRTTWVQTGVTVWKCGRPASGSSRLGIVTSRTSWTFPARQWRHPMSPRSPHGTGLPPPPRSNGRITFARGCVARAGTTTMALQSLFHRILSLPASTLRQSCLLHQLVRTLAIRGIPHRPPLTATTGPHPGTRATLRPAGSSSI